MLDALKNLFENDALSEEVRSELEEAWNAKVKENRLEVTSELREEFAKKYEHDKATMVEAIDSLVTEKLAEEIAEFQDDRKQLAEAKAKFAVAQRKVFEPMRKRHQQELLFFLQYHSYLLLSKPLQERIWHSLCFLFQ